MQPIRHTTCGTECVPRWVLADDGDNVIVAWCPRCDDAPGCDELSRPIDRRVVDFDLVVQIATAITNTTKH